MKSAREKNKTGKEVENGEGEEVTQVLSSRWTFGLEAYIFNVNFVKFYIKYCEDLAGHTKPKDRQFANLAEKTRTVPVGGKG